MKAYVQTGLALLAAALVAWMLFWGSEYADASDDVLMMHWRIEQEFEPVPYVDEYDEAGNEEIAKQVVEFRREAAAEARSNRGVAHERANRAKFMLTTISIWASGILLACILVALISGYKINLVPRKP